MQLDATLRSFLLHCADGADTKLTVLYHATSALYARQYAELAEAYCLQTNLRFQSQVHFRQDVLSFLAVHADLRYGADLYHRLARLHRRLGFLGQPLLRFGKPSYVFFLVDDNLFVSKFCLFDALRSLEREPQALGFSLRLGRNTTYCYTRDLPQSLPEFNTSGEDVLCFDWRRGELDFAYPLEVSSSIYRTADLLPLLNRKRFANPNQLESRLAESADQYIYRPLLLCLPKSVAFSNPINQVAERYQNRAGVIHTYSSHDLAVIFEKGMRVDVAVYTGFVPQGCHQEVELNFYRPERDVNGC